MWYKFGLPLFRLYLFLVTLFACGAATVEYKRQIAADDELVQYHRADVVLRLQAMQGNVKCTEE